MEENLWLLDYACGDEGEEKEKGEKEGRVWHGGGWFFGRGELGKQYLHCLFFFFLSLFLCFNSLVVCFFKNL